MCQIRIEFETKFSYKYSIESSKADCTADKDFHKFWFYLFKISNVYKHSSLSKRSVHSGFLTNTPYGQEAENGIQDLEILESDCRQIQVNG